MTVKYFRLDELVPWELNPRKHDIAYLRQSIRDFGFWGTIDVRHMGILHGHGRTQALIEMMNDGEDVPRGIQVNDEDGMWLVPGDVLDHLSEEEARAAVLRDNEASRRGRRDNKKVKIILDKGLLQEGQTGLTPKQLRDIRNPQKRIKVVATSTAQETPLVTFPSEPQFGIPQLDLDMQADMADQPFLKWGTQPRTSKHNIGTVHFYTDDEKFNGLVKNPMMLVDTEAITTVELNFTTHYQMPRYEALHRIGQKRYIARLWQNFGIQVLVDLNVSVAFQRDNLLGVPAGWGAYATRAMKGQEELLDAEYMLAEEHCGSKPHIFLVYGGGKTIRDYCATQNWVWIPDYRDVVNGR